MIRVRYLVVASLLTLVGAAGPIRAHAPLNLAEETSTVACDRITGASGTVRATASVSTLTGAAGFLLFWAAPDDPGSSPPTLVSMGMDAAVQADGSLVASYDMFIPGDLGFGAAEPVFVGTAQLTSVLAAIGPPDAIDTVTRNGNSQFRVQGSSQTLDVAGEVTVPVAGWHALSGCTGERETLSYFATRPDADVSTVDRTTLGCFWLTDTGVVAIDAQSDENDAFVTAFVLVGSGSYFGISVLSLERDGVDATIGLDPAGSLTISASFASVERTKFRESAGNGWVMVTVDALSVEGHAWLETPAGTSVLNMDDASCVAEARDVISLATSPPGQLHSLVR
jgi:hypothetical protein